MNAAYDGGFGLLQKTHSNTVTDLMAARPKKIKTHDHLVQAEELILHSHLEVRV